MDQRLNDYTRQSIFDRAVRGLASQGWVRCVNTLGECDLKNDLGQRCAFGHAFPDTDWSLSYEADRRAGQQFMRSFMDAHDRAKPDTMRERFRGLADEYNLAWPADVT